MHNIFTKSLKNIILCFVSLIFFTCTTTTYGSKPQKNGISINNLFPNDKKLIIFLNTDDNKYFISNLLANNSMLESGKDIIDKSDEIYLALGENPNDVDILLKGHYPKFLMGIGLFFSFQWSEVSNNGVAFWHNKGGFDVIIKDDQTILLSGLNIASFEKKLSTNYIEKPKSSMLFFIPNISREMLKKLTMGFLKTGVDSLKIESNKKDNIYNSTCTLAFPTERKAKAFSRIIGLAITLMSAGISDPKIKDAIRNINIESDENKLLIKNILLDEIKTAEIVSKMITQNGEFY